MEPFGRPMAPDPRSPLLNRAQSPARRLGHFVWYRFVAKMAPVACSGTKCYPTKTVFLPSFLRIPWYPYSLPCPAYHTLRIAGSRRLSGSLGCTASGEPPSCRYQQSTAAAVWTAAVSTVLHRRAGLSHNYGADAPSCSWAPGGDHDEASPRPSHWILDCSVRHVKNRYERDGGSTALFTGQSSCPAAIALSVTSCVQVLCTA